MKNKLKIKNFLYNNKVVLITTLVLFLLIGASIYLTFAYYTDSSTENLINGSVGYFENSDLNINFMVEDRDSDGLGIDSYTAYWVAPNTDYIYNSETSYCENGATFTVDDQNNFTVSTSGKTKCYFYYDAVDLETDSDIKIVVMREAKGAVNADANGYIDASSYSLVGLYNLGLGYNASMTSCENGAYVVFDLETNEIEVITDSKTTCTVYFDKASYVAK